MLINKDKKIIILLTPRCASTSLANMYNGVKGFEIITKMFHTDTANHIRMLELTEIDYKKYVIFLVYRPIIDWVKSCYCNFAEFFKKKANNFSFEEFIENNGTDVRFNDHIGWDWFSYSPENMITDINGKVFECEKYHFVNLKNIKSELIDVLEKNYEIKPVKMVHVNSVAKKLENKILTHDQIEKIKKFCCPLNILKQGADEC